LSFLLLLLLVPLLAWVVSRKAQEIDARANQDRARYAKIDDAITDVRGEVYRVALLLREASPGSEQDRLRRDLVGVRDQTDRDLNLLEGSLETSERTNLEALRAQLSSYLKFADQSVDASGGGLPSRNVPGGERVRQRETVLKLVERIDQLNSDTLVLEEQEIDSQHQALRRFATGATTVFVLLGVIIGAGSSAYLARLEIMSERQAERAEQAEGELRRLSNQLVSAQEEERRSISRELHDEVGQVLTGLRMELGGLWRGDADAGFPERLDSVKGLAEEALRSIRNLSLLLRPSMLDDLGLGPAVRWQAKEFSRRTGIPAHIEIEGSIDNLPEPFRICLYRVIQEALTNCAKHSQATRVSVSINQEAYRVLATVQDNGVGFRVQNARDRGLGLVGMEERVKSLGGRLTISAQPGTGTTVRIELPLVATARAV
jgi:signal transduction histidine kinase